MLTEQLTAHSTQQPLTMSLVYTTEQGSGTVGRKPHGLYLGSKADAKSLEKLKQWGVTHILNVTPEKEAGVKSGVANFFESSRAFTYKRIPVYDAATSDLLTHANAVVGFISSGLCHGSVMVHCQRGQSRSVTCVAFYLMRKAGMTLEDAMTMIRKARPEAEPIAAFMSQLERYEKQCMKIGVIDANRKPLDGQKHPKKRRIIGPSLGPIAGPMPENDEMPKAQEIGPQLPAAPEEVSSQKQKDASIIGPSLPPGCDKEKTKETVSNKDPPIGPSLPPSHT